MFRIGRRQLLFGEMEMPDELDDMAGIRAELEALLDGTLAAGDRLLTTLPTKRLVDRSKVADMDQAAVRSLFDLTERVAIVTGGTRGIGLAIASGFVGAGREGRRREPQSRGLRGHREAADRRRRRGARRTHASR